MLPPSRYPARGPLGEPLGTHWSFHDNNIGFFISRSGLFWSYYSGDCMCQSLDRTYHIVPADTSRPSALGTTVLTLKEHGTLSNFAVGVANSEQNYFLPMEEAAPSVGMQVYAIGRRNQSFIVTQGRIVEIEAPSAANVQVGEIICELQVYHGFCGGPLISERGTLLGFGAKHPGARSREKGAYRRFDRGLFEDARSLVALQRDNLPREVLENGWRTWRLCQD